jgi:hypothetical protein
MHLKMCPFEMHLHLQMCLSVMHIQICLKGKQLKTCLHNASKAVSIMYAFTDALESNASKDVSVTTVCKEEVLF